LFPSEIMFESFNIPGLYIAVQVRIYMYSSVLFWVYVILSLAS